MVDQYSGVGVNLQTMGRGVVQIAGELPQVVGDTLVWPKAPTKQQLETPLREELKQFVRDRGEEFVRRVEVEAGGGVATQGHLFKVTQEWEEPPRLVRRELKVVMEEEEEGVPQEVRREEGEDVAQDVVEVGEEDVVQEDGGNQEMTIGPLEVALAALILKMRESEERSMMEEDVE